jgi:branched-chain amino acid transport system permease protein
MKGTTKLAVLGVLVVLGVLPFFLSSSLLLIVFLSFLWLVLAANYDIAGGFMGYINLAQGAFFGLGAYVAVVLLNVEGVQQLGAVALPVAFLAAVVAAGLFAGLMSFPLFRLRGLYFAIATLIVLFFLGILVLNLSDLTGGSYGIYVPRNYWLSDFSGYYFALLLAAISVGFNFYLSRSKLGLAFLCIKEDEEAASSIGIPLMRYKITGYVIGSLPSAVAGVIFALTSTYIDADIAMGVERSLLPPVMALLGGTGTVLGPVIGVAIIRVIDVAFFQYLALPIPSMIFFGVTLMIVALFIPEGLLRSPRVRRLWAALRGKAPARRQVSVSE